VAFIVALAYIAIDFVQQLSIHACSGIFTFEFCVGLVILDSGLPYRPAYARDIQHLTRDTTKVTKIVFKIWLLPRFSDFFPISSSDVIYASTPASHIKKLGSISLP
jgi:hypothetical protein